MRMAWLNCEGWYLQRHHVQWQKWQCGGKPNKTKARGQVRPRQKRSRPRMLETGLLGYGPEIFAMAATNAQQRSRYANVSIGWYIGQKQRIS